jgi:hypothetical protein
VHCLLTQDDEKARIVVVKNPKDDSHHEWLLGKNLEGNGLDLFGAPRRLHVSAVRLGRTHPGPTLRVQRQGVRAPPDKFLESDASRGVRAIRSCEGRAFAALS